MLRIKQLTNVQTNDLLTTEDKMKTKITGLVCASILMALFFVAPQKAYSQSISAVCTVQEVVQGANNAQVRLTDISGTFDNRLFNLQSSNLSARNAQLATILTAISTGKNIRVTFQNGNPPTIIVVAYINN